ncbi:hypothetical protein CT0861_11848 [Colletotrichum tofieldiae]|uniref:Uncharacterized protein n=1 Tax=Colletotrichum tofieldiae TaxID=708197 RepID=A0A161YH38_9PEZI|nr:hypothetical protein CT0861_11848 [Colletotrichum tofieldiae]
MLTLMAVAFACTIRESPLPRKAKLNNFILLILMHITHINSISRREQEAHTLHLSASLKHHRGLNYILLDLTYIKMYIFTDRLFINNADLSLQLGYVIILAKETLCTTTDFHIKGNIIH